MVQTLSIYLTLDIQKQKLTLTSTSYNKAETGNLLCQKVKASGNNVSSSRLEANAFRCGEIKVVSDDDLNALTLTINSKCIYNRLKNRGSIR